MKVLGNLGILENLPSWDTKYDDSLGHSFLNNTVRVVIFDKNGFGATTVVWV